MAKSLFGLAISPNAEKYLDSLQDRKIRAQIAKRIKGLVLEPRPQGCEKLKCWKDGDNPVWKIRSGNYRILYVIESNPGRVIVIDVDDRKDVYR